MVDYKEADTYVVTIVSFGDKPAGNIATLSLRKTAKMVEKMFPQASEMIMKKTYVGDIIYSFNNHSEAEKTTSDVSLLTKRGDFKIKKWCISQNHQEVSETAEVPVDTNLKNTELSA